VGDIKNLTGDQFPVIIKLNCQDFLQGFTVTNAAQTGATLFKVRIVTVIKIFKGLFEINRKNETVRSFGGEILWRMRQTTTFACGIMG